MEALFASATSMAGRSRSLELPSLTISPHSAARRLFWRAQASSFARAATASSPYNGGQFQIEIPAGIMSEYLVEMDRNLE
jgi:hypothetical protein